MFKTVMQIRKTVCTSAALFVTAAFLAATSAAAEYKVIESDVPEIFANQTFADDTVFQVPDGAKLTLQKLPEGSTHIIEGPYDGTVANYATQAKCPWWRRILGLCEDANGTDRTGTTGVRGIR